MILTSSMGTLKAALLPWGEAYLHLLQIDSVITQVRQRRKAHSCSKPCITRRVSAQRYINRLGTEASFNEEIDAILPRYAIWDQANNQNNFRQYPRDENRGQLTESCNYDNETETSM